MDFKARRIKFKVFDRVHKKCHIVGEDHHDAMKCDWPDNEVYYLNYQCGEGSITYDEKLPEDGSGFILMQYTGMNDKKGIEIYEGDKCLVYRPCVCAKGFICFYKGCFIFEEFRIGNIIRLCDLELNGYDIEVIGNIYENPELRNSIS